MWHCRRIFAQWGEIIVFGDTNSVIRGREAEIGIRWDDKWHINRIPVQFYYPHIHIILLWTLCWINFSLHFPPPRSFCWILNEYLYILVGEKKALFSPLLRVGWAVLPRHLHLTTYQPVLVCILILCHWLLLKGWWLKWGLGDGCIYYQNNLVESDLLLGQNIFILISNVFHFL